MNLSPLYRRQTDADFPIINYPSECDHPDPIPWVREPLRLFSGNNTCRLFHDQIILYRVDPFDAACDFTRFIDRLLRINEAAELNAALESLDTDLK